MIGSGGFSLVEKTKGLEKFYLNNKHCIFFYDYIDLKEKMKYWLDLKRDSKRNKIRIDGFHHAHKFNSYGVRIKKLLENIFYYIDNNIKDSK